MKFLFAANRFPFPPFRGDKLKIFHLARFLSLEHELHLLTFIQDKDDMMYIPVLEQFFTKIHLVYLPKNKSYLHTLPAAFSSKPFQVHYFRSREMAKKAKELYETENYDAVHVQHLRMAQYWANFKNIPRILDLPDAYSLYWERRVKQFKGWKKIFAKIEQKRIFRYEAKMLKQFELTLVCSKEDAAHLKEKHRLDNVAILPNGVDTDHFPLDPHDYFTESNILFTGNMDYAPNVDAVLYFAKELFPTIKKRVPGAKFIIAGQRPVKKILNLRSDDFRVTGFVKDFGQLYNDATILVAPLRFGAGTQNKVLEAMAMGVPVVSGKIGFEGLNIQSGEGVFLAENNEAFIEHCVALLLDRDLRKTTGEAGQNIVGKYFTWPTIAGTLDDYLKKILKKQA